MKSLRQKIIMVLTLEQNLHKQNFWVVKGVKKHGLWLKVIRGWDLVYRFFAFNNESSF